MGGRQLKRAPAIVHRHRVRHPRARERPDTAEDARSIARLVGFARVGASVLFEQDSAGPVAFTAAVQQRFGLRSDEAEALIDALEAEIREESSTLSLELPLGFSHARVQEEARALARSRQGRARRTRRALPVGRTVVLEELTPDVLAGREAGDDRVDDA